MPNFINLNSIFADEIGLNYGQLKLQRSPTQSNPYNFIFPPAPGTTGQALFWNGGETTFRGIEIADITNLQTNLDAIDATIANLNTTYAPIIHDHSGTNGDGFTINLNTANTGTDRSLTLARSTSQSTSYSLAFPASLGTANQALIINSVSGSSANLAWGNVAGGFSNVASYSTASINIDLANGTAIAINLTQNSSVASITGIPSGIQGIEFTIFCAQDAIGGRTLSFPPNTTVTGSISTIANTTSIIKMLSRNGGSNWDAIVIKPLPNAISTTTWTPANITSALWLDPSDSSTVFLGSGISQINDKSGNSRHTTQSTASKQPALITGGLNSKNIIRFDGNDDGLNYNNSFLNNTNYLIAIVVARRSNKIDNYFLGNPSAQFSSNQLLHLGWRTDTQVTHAQWFNDYNISVSSYSSPEYDIWCFTHSSTSGKTIHKNGVSVGSNLNTDSLNSHSLGVIGESNGGFFNGDICEIVILTGANVNATNRQLLEGYYASPNRWNLQSKLDASHPYKSSPPTI